MAPRPALSGPRRGKPISLLTNHFKFVIENVPDFFEYGLKVRCLKTNQEITGGKRRRVLTILLKDGRFAHSFTDYASKIFTVKAFPLTSREGLSEETYPIALYNEGQPLPAANTAPTHRVELVLRRQLSLEPFRKYLANPGAMKFDRLDEYLGFFDLMLSHWPDQQNDMTTVARGSKYFHLNANRANLGGGLVAIVGFFRSVKSSLASGLLLNINPTSAAFFDDALRVDQVIDRLPIAQGLPVTQKVREITKRLRGMRFSTSYNTFQVRTFYEIANSTTNLTVLPDNDMVTFQKKEGNILTVNQHFNHEYREVFRPNRKSLSINIAGPGHRPIFIPSDLAKVEPGQHYSLLLDDAIQATKMIQSACRKPDKNRELIIEEGLRHLAIGQPIPPRGSGALFSVRPDVNMLKLNGRLLDAPFLKFSSPKEDPAGKTGRWDLRNKRFRTSVNLERWKCGILHFHRGGSSMPAANIPALRTGISEGIRSYTGVQGVQPVPFSAGRFPTGTAQDVKLALAKLLTPLKTQNFGVVFVVLPNKSSFNYSMLKYVADVQVGIHTVCTVIKDDNTVKISPGEVANLLLKANMKLGGINHTLHQRSQPSLLTTNSIIIGLDVTHPGQSAMEGAPSVAAIVGTRGSDFFRYSGFLQLQTHRNEDKKAVEELLQLKHMMLRQLKSYQKDNKGALPNRVFVYRDGVGDSQMQIILEREIPRIREAFVELYSPATMPELVFLVAQKRHHTRFFQGRLDRHPAFDEKGNVNPGVVHDSEIASERRWDFYLNSHICIQGTARPCHYTVIYHNLKNITADDVEELTHRLTWLFGRSTTSISIAPAARYADMLCDRGRCYMHEVYTGGSRQTYVPTTTAWTGGVAEALAESMFFV